MADVFISYAREDRATAALVAGWLDTAGLTVWWDERLQGQRADPEIRRQIGEATSVVVLLSGAALRSDWVRGEMEVGRVGNKLVPVWIEPMARDALPTPLIGWHILDLSGWKGDLPQPQLLKLAARCAELRAGRDRPDETPRREPRPSASPRSAAAGESARIHTNIVHNSGMVISGKVGKVTTINVTGAGKSAARRQGKKPQ